MSAWLTSRHLGSFRRELDYVAPDRLSFASKD